MKEFLQIELHASYFGHHGLYEQENRLGTNFDIHLIVDIEPGNGEITSIGNTVNYVRLHELVASEMKTPRPLLETLAMDIANKTGERFTQVRRVSIRIAKTNAPIAQFSGEVAVTYKKEFPV